MRKALVVALLCAPAALAYDPRYVWLTIDTPHFEVHFHQGEFAFAAKVARIAESAHERLVPLFGHVPPERTQIVLTDDSDFANGSATPLLYDLVHGFAATPDPRSTISDFDDWVAELIEHEYTHILHLDTVGGIPRVANAVFGKIWIPNGIQPPWFIEGMAVLAESEVGGAGRIRATTEEMSVRAEALSGGLSRIDRLSSMPLAWPRANDWYTIGGRFLTWIGDEYGLGALRELSHDYGSRFVPFALNLSGDRVLGKSYLDLYEEFRAAEEKKARTLQADVRAEGETRVELLTRLGELTHSPRWSTDSATLYYLNVGPDRLPQIRAVRPGPCCRAGAEALAPTLLDDRHISDSYGDGTLAVDSRGRVVFARTQVFQEFAGVQDLYRVDPATGHVERVTRGLRASEPSVAPDGAIAFSWRLAGGGTAIGLLEPGARDPRVLFEDSSGEPVASPRFNPSGDRVAFLHHRHGAWDVRIVARSGGTPLDVTHDRAFDRDPTWSPDGRYLLFSSDRSGVFDIYAFRLDDQTLWRATNVVLGAFEPDVSPDGSQLALVTYSARGYDIARMPFDPAQLVAVDPGTPPSPSRPPPAALPPEEIYPVRPYNPFPTLLPHWWLPFAAKDALGTTVGAITAGFDAVLRHEYQAAAWWAIDSRQPGWDVVYTNHATYADISVSALRDVETPSGAGPGHTDRVLQGILSASFPFSQVERSHQIAAQYELTHYSQNTPAVAGNDPPPGLIAAVSLTYIYSDTRRFVRSISQEQGQRFSITGRVAAPALGSDFTFGQLYSSYAHFVPLPWTSDGVPLHHVFAVRLSGGVARGDLSERHLFELGGFDPGDPIRAILDPASAPVRILRGFVADAFAGEAYAVGTFEYRLPLLDVETGAWTLPVYLRRLHASLFSDVGDAWMPFDDGPFRAANATFRLHAGAGAELRAQVVLGYVLPTDVRLGCAHGLENSSVSILECYAAIGGVF
ncbi:MAG TPA: BamA/TamA family outer membrane protein [Myxococcales bacterium]|nr:BamA/TamA family outer membrane protein [Myxococcales bacterium]